MDAEENIFQKVTRWQSEAIRSGEESFIELMQSKIHDCDAQLDPKDVVYYTTPEGIFKVIDNLHGIFCLPTGKKVKCCQYCGYSPNKEGNTHDNPNPT